MIGASVLSIAGSDPSGGAGIQADLKTIAACGGYGMSVITALTAQNTLGVQDVHVPPAPFLARQLDSVLSDLPPAAVKIGMLGSTEVISTVAEALQPLRSAAEPVPVVLDPVMVATSGDRLLEGEAETALLRLLQLVDVITPNVPELAVLLGSEPATDTASLVEQGRTLARAHRVWVLAKGGHLDPGTDGEVTDVLCAPDGEVRAFTHPFRSTANTHGTGCTLSSALATFAARGADWPRATALATDYLAAALAGADALGGSGSGLGHGHGPVDHLGRLWSGDGAPSLGLAGAWWEELAGRALDAEGTTVVSGLASGQPDPELLRRYLAQDLAYLGDYASRLEALGTAATERGDREAAEYWSASAAAARHEEPALHERLGASTPEPDAVTLAYAQFFASAEADGPEVLAAAVLPCYLLYSEIGIRLAERLGDALGEASDEAREWITTYADPAFAASAATATAFVDAAAERSDAATRERMRAAMAEALEREIAFFGR